MKRKRIFQMFLVVLALALCLCVPAFAAGGDVAGAVEQTWTDASSQIKTVVDNVVFPALSMVLAIAFFAKLAMAYFDYRKHGQFEWAGPVILFVCLVFVLLAPNYIWASSDLREDAMQREEFETRIRELLPGSSEIALATVTTYAEEPDELAIELSDGAGHFYDAFYVNLALVRRDYGEDIAQSIFNHGERYLFYPSELRAVARLVASGSSMEQIMDCIETFGCVGHECRERRVSGDSVPVSKRRERNPCAALSTPLTETCGMEMG